MALGSLPPWLQISPSDYLKATQSGVSAGQAIAERNIRAFEEQQRIKMAGEHQQNVLAQQGIENAANRLAAERLEDYRHSEITNRQSQLGIENKRLGSLDLHQKQQDIFQQQRDDEIARHNKATEEAKLTGHPEAGITTLPDAPGFTFLRNPSGALTTLLRPPHLQSPLEKARLQMSGINAMAPRGGEDPTSADYQTRTNAIGSILRSLNPQSSPLAIPDAPKAAKDRKANTAYKTPKGVFNWTGSGWSAPQSQGILSQPEDTIDDGE